MRTHLAVAAATGILAGMPAAAIARPADVVIVNSQSQPVHVQVTGTPAVTVDTEAGPVHVRERSTFFADSMSLVASADSSICKNLELQPGGRVRLTSIVASATGSAEPGVAMRVWSERDPETAAGNGIRIDLPVSLDPMTTSGFSWGGSLTTSIMLGTGSIASLDGLGTDVSVCVQAPPGNPTTTHVYLSGEYL